MDALSEVKACAFYLLVVEPTSSQRPVPPFIECVWTLTTLEFRGKVIQSAPAYFSDPDDEEAIGTRFYQMAHLPHTPSFALVASDHDCLVLLNLRTGHMKPLFMAYGATAEPLTCIVTVEVSEDGKYCAIGTTQPPAIAIFQIVTDSNLELRWVAQVETDVRPRCVRFLRTTEPTLLLVVGSAASSGLTFFEASPANVVKHNDLTECASHTLTGVCNDVAVFPDGTVAVVRYGESCVELYRPSRTFLQQLNKRKAAATADHILDDRWEKTAVVSIQFRPIYCCAYDSRTLVVNCSQFPSNRHDLAVVDIVAGTLLRMIPLGEGKCGRGITTDRSSGSVFTMYTNGETKRLR